MKRATLLLAAALIAALSLTSCAHLRISTPQPNQEVPWKDETAAAFGEITGGSVTSAVTDGGIGVVTRDSKVHGQAAVLYLDMKEDAGVSVSCRITGASRAVRLSYRAPDGSVTTLAEDEKGDGGGGGFPLPPGGARRAGARGQRLLHPPAHRGGA